MTSILITLFAIYYGVLILTLVCNCQNIVFAHKVNFGNKKNITEGIPVHIPGQCPDHMGPYPSPDNKSSWICDCLSGYIYFPLNDSCYKPYRRGPCKPDEYMVLPKDKVVSKCDVNPCKEDGLVPFNGSCYPVDAKEGPCGDDILAVNGTTFQLECMPVDLAPFLIIDAPSKDDGCPRGTRRTAQGLCRAPL